MLQITCAENFMRVMPKHFVPKNRQVIHVIGKNATVMQQCFKAFFPDMFCCIFYEIFMLI